MATENHPARLGTLACVCKAWNALMSDDYLWKPIFDQCMANLTYDMDLSSAKTLRDKVILIDQTKLHDFFKTLLECNGVLKEDKWIKPTDFIKAKYYLNEYDFTDLIIQLILRDLVDTVAKLILFKPKFNATRVAHHLFSTSFIKSSEMYVFCIHLMVKLRYNLNSFFKGNVKWVDRLISFQFKNCNINGIKISDYITVGLDCNQAGKESLLCKMLPELEFFYLLGPWANLIVASFQSPQPNLTGQLSDEKFARHVRKDPFSENDLKEFILDMLIQEKANPVIYPAKGTFPGGNAISQFRHVVNEMVNNHTIPASNAFSQALAAFDEAKQLKSDD